jgi:hypothetical protein
MDSPVIIPYYDVTVLGVTAPNITRGTLGMYPLDGVR